MGNGPGRYVTSGMKSGESPILHFHNFPSSLLSYFSRPFFGNTSSEKSSDSCEEKSELGLEEEECLHHRSKSVSAGQQQQQSKCLARRLLSHSPFQHQSEMVHNNGKADNSSRVATMPNTMVSNCLISSQQGQNNEKNIEMVAIDLVQFKYQTQ